MRYAKKRFGQNFLIDPNILRKIVNTIDPQKDEGIIEIGPGQGALTELLLESGAIVHAIEIDKDLIPELETRFAGYNNFNIYNADALGFDFSPIFTKHQAVKFTGNVPYNITSPLLEIAYYNAHALSSLLFLVQKEFAKRVTATPGNKDFGILSLMSQYFGTPKIHFDVPPMVFRPIPKVTSSFFSIQFNSGKINYGFVKHFQIVVKTAFNKKRKTLRNSLRNIFSDNISSCPIDLGKRPEELNLQQFILLTEFIEKNTTFFLSV